MALRDRVAVLGIVVAAAASLFGLSHPWFAGSSDAAIYVHCARALLAGEGYSWMGEPFHMRPPGFSALIAPVIAARGVDFAALNLFVGLWGVACAALYFVWLRASVSIWTALALVLLLWFNPGFACLRTQVMSDVPGTALILACLLLERWSARRPSLPRELALGLAIGLSAYVRALCILLLPAIALARFLDQRRTTKEAAAPDLSSARALAGRVLPFTVAALLVQLPWSVRNALHRPEPPVDQYSAYDYSSRMWHVDCSDPRSKCLPASIVLWRVPRHAEGVLVGLGSRLQSEELDGASASLGTAFVLALIWAAWRRRGSAELFAFAAIALVLVSFLQGRVLLPVLLVAWAALAEALEAAGRHLLGAARAPLLACVPALALFAADLHPRVGWDAVRVQHEKYTRWCARLADLLPRDARMAVPTEGWRYSLWLDRPVWTLFFGWMRGGGPAGAEQVIDRHGINTVVIPAFEPIDAAMRDYFVQRYGVRVQEEGITVVRVR